MLELGVLPDVSCTTGQACTPCHGWLAMTAQDPSDSCLPVRCDSRVYMPTAASVQRLSADICMLQAF